MIENAVRDFLNALGPDLRRRALFPFEAEERFNWHYIPRERNGVMLKAMSEAQRQAAMALLRAAPASAAIPGPRPSCGSKMCSPKSRPIPRPTGP